MKPHLYKLWSRWACKIHMPVMQRGHATVVVMYMAEGDTPAAAYENCTKCFKERTTGAVKC